jgi:hypothetical protein
MTRGTRILAVAAIVAIAPAFSACAYAQYGPRGGYGHVASPAYDIGYREGLDRGSQDARRGTRFGFERDRDYQRADKGWNRRHGNRDAYRYEFRRGYERGYREAYSRYGAGYGRGRYDNRYPSGEYRGGGYAYRSPAAEHGFREGYERGREAARDRDRHDPARERWYRDGDRHYNSRYGSRDQWKQEYRDAFRQGYDRGYREGR